MVLVMVSEGYGVDYIRFYADFLTAIFILVIGSDLWLNIVVISRLQYYLSAFPHYNVIGSDE